MIAADSSNDSDRWLEDSDAIVKRAGRMTTDFLYEIAATSR